MQRITTNIFNTSMRLVRQHLHGFINLQRLLMSQIFKCQYISCMERCLLNSSIGNPGPTAQGLSILQEIGLVLHVQQPWIASVWLIIFITRTFGSQLIVIETRKSGKR